eukprot:s2676_g4.t1
MVRRILRRHGTLRRAVLICSLVCGVALVTAWSGRAFSLVRPDLPDWTAEFEEAKAKYNTAEQDLSTAEQKLEEELQKENLKASYIEFLQQAMQNSQKRLDFAQKDKEHAQQMLLQAQFGVPLPIRSSFANKDGLFNLLGTSGMKGIGKTQLLLNSLQAVENPSNTKAVYFTFNRHGELKDRFHDSLGHAVLTACDVPKELAMTCNFDKCLGIVRKLVSASSDERLVIFIDEVGLLDAYEKEPVVVPLLQSLMRCMDKRKGKLVFVFSRLLEEMLKRGATDESGRKIAGIPLVALAIDIWRTNPDFSTWAEAAFKHAGIHQLLLSCAGHPRCLFEGLKVLDDLCKSPPQTATALDRARQQIINECKFDGMECTLEESVLMQWFSPPEQMNKTALDRAGLLVRVKTGLGEETSSFLHPLVLSWWAQENQRSSEKRMEGLMFYYEAVLRIALQGKPIELSKFYVTDYIGDNFKKMLLVGALPQGGGSLVEFVKDFSDVKLVIDWRKKGAIVVSQKQSEKGVEYLTPWRLNDAEGKLVVACVQFVKEEVSWIEIQEHMHSAVIPLKQKNIEVFPVIYATLDQDTIQESTYNDGVYFNEVSIFKFTSKLGILRLHTEKRVKSLQKEVPVLNRSRSEVAD